MQQYLKKIQQRYYKYIKTKTKTCSKIINMDFYGNKMPKESSQCICLSVIFLDFVYRKAESYYLQVILEERKCVRNPISTSLFGSAVSLQGRGGKLSPPLLPPALVFSRSTCLIHFRLGKYLTHHKYFQNDTLSHMTF